MESAAVGSPGMKIGKGRRGYDNFSRLRKCSLIIIELVAVLRSTAQGAQ